MNPELVFALELADRADAIALEHFRSARLVVETKPDLTPVTVADRAVEEALRAVIERERPRVEILGEEYGTQAGSGAGTRWIIDPIDATRNYIRGIPVFATLIALEREGELELGVASAPALARRWWAVRGEGAFADGAPIRVSSISRLEDALFSHTSASSRTAQGIGDQLLALGRRCSSACGFGDFWQHMLVAEGSLEFAVDPVIEPWDVAAVKVIVKEAGGRFSDLQGDPRIDGGSAVSSNGILHRDVLAALARDG